jgi:hypothetical protein
VGTGRIGVIALAEATIDAGGQLAGFEDGAAQLDWVVTEGLLACRLLWAVVPGFGLSNFGDSGPLCGTGRFY